MLLDDQLARIDSVLARIEGLAEELRADPDGHVRRSANELRAAFAARAPVEPAVARMRDSVRMLRRNNAEGGRREFQRRVQGVERLEHIVDDDLVPQLRQMGFSV